MALENKKIKVIFKRTASEYATEIEAEDSLEMFQQLVGGDIELVYFGIPNLRIVCDDMGKMKRKYPNFRLMYACRNNVIVPSEDVIFGDVVFVGIDSREGKFRSIKEHEKKLINRIIASGMKSLVRDTRWNLF